MIAHAVHAGTPQVLKLLTQERGQKFGANWTGAWDKMIAGETRLVTVNRGKGFEAAIAVFAVEAPKDLGVSAHMIYYGPYKVTNLPTAKEMLQFECSDGLFLAGL
jgi:hypothetical protein